MKNLTEAANFIDLLTQLCKNRKFITNQSEHLLIKFVSLYPNSFILMRICYLVYCHILLI